MHDYSFYSAILGLSSVWRIADVTIDENSGDIELHIRSTTGSMFSCPTCGALKLPSSVNKARWLHENHLNIRFYISTLIPIIDCECCGEMKVEVPWKKAGVVCEEETHDVMQRGDQTVDASSTDKALTTCIATKHD
jgi:predicted RNA-binding Zn-ribbon protein involved in translation (DUF1610 family)